jgi:hypothetical protein
MATQLFNPMGSTDTVATVYGGALSLVSPGLIQIDSEQMQYTLATDTQIYGLTRGVNGTAAAAHLKNAAVTVLEQAPFAPVLPTSLLIPQQLGTSLAEVDNAGVLVDPTAFTQTQIDQNTVLWVRTTAGNATLTLQAPLIALARQLMVIHTTTAARTCTVNGTTITAGTGQVFIYDPQSAAWYVC